MAGRGFDVSVRGDELAFSSGIDGSVEGITLHTDEGVFPMF